MTLINIHPHRGFLNTRFSILSTDCIGKTIEIRPLSYFSPNNSVSLNTSIYHVVDCDNKYFNFTPQFAGEFALVVENVQMSTFIVEDAIKLGGSQYKNSYIFDKTPWCFVVMKDRTYFYNRKTTQQYVESISPDSISFVSDNLITLSNKEQDEESIYSLILQKPILQYKNKVILTETVLVSKQIRDNSSLALTVYTFSAIDGVIKKLEQQCEAYSISSDKKLVYFVFGKSISAIQLDNGIIKVIERSDYYSSNNIFKVIGFVGNDYIIRQRVSKYRSEILISDLRNTKNITCRFFNYPVSLNIEDDQNALKHQANLTNKLEKLVEHLNETDMIQYLSIEFHYFRLSNFIDINGILYYLEIEEIKNVTTFGAKWKKSFLKVKQSKDLSEILLEHYPQIKRDGNYLKVKDDDDIFYLSGTEKIERIEEKVEPCASEPDKLPENAICSSESGLYSLTMEGTHLFLSRQIGDSAKQIFSKQEILIGLYDHSSFGNVYLSDDGENIIYQKGEEMTLLNTQTNQSESFPNLKFIGHVNGYRPLFKIDSYRRPRIVNPLTGLYIDEDFTSQYFLLSPDKKYYADSNLNKYVKYYNLLDSNYITEQEYFQFVNEYKYDWRADKEVQEKIKQKRADFIEKYSFLFPGTKEDSDYKVILTSDNFCSYIIERRAFAIIRKCDDKQIVAEIPLGPPLWFLNFVSFSLDSRYVAIAGRYPNNTFCKSKDCNISGLMLIYDLITKTIIDNEVVSHAVWVTAFTVNGYYAAYSSCPIVYTGNINGDKLSVENKSFLTFSPDGKYMAMSNQGYICYNKDKDCWGHQPSTEVFIAPSNTPNTTLYHFNDLPDDGIDGQQCRNTVASCSFSTNNNKLMMAGNDKTVVIRNLYLK